MNNQYGMGGQTCGETMGYDVAARIGAGVNRDGMHAERVDGYNWVPFSRPLPPTSPNAV